MKSAKIRLDLNYIQELQLNTLSNEHRLLYNALLAYFKTGIYDFAKLAHFYVDFRNNNNLTIKSTAAQNTCRKFIDNIKSYYALRKKDVTAKPPRYFKKWNEFQSFIINHGDSFKLKNNILKFPLYGNQWGKNLIIKYLEIQLPELYHNILTLDNIKTCTFTKNKNKYYLNIAYSENKQIKQLNPDNFIAIDLGISNIVTTYSNTANNIQVKNNKFESLNKTQNILQSKLSKKQKNSKKYNKLKNKFLKSKTKLNNKQKDFQHKLSKNIIDIAVQNDIGTLIVGDIETKKIIKHENKSLKATSKNFGLSRFKTFLKYKAEDVGIKYNLINEAYTSQTNSLTGKKFPDKLNLSDREVQLSSTITIDRDLNAAINIAKRKIKGECYPHYATLGLQKIYMTNDSKFVVYENSYL